MDDTESPKELAVNYLVQKVGQGNNGIVLVINMSQRKLYIWATGNLKYYITSSRIESILDVVQPQLSDGNYPQAIESFYAQVTHYYEQGYLADENIRLTRKREPLLFIVPSVLLIF